MPETKTLRRAQADKRAGKSASTQAGEFVKEEVDNVREGKHGVRSAKQAIAIGLSKARRAGIALKPPAVGKTSTATRKKAEKDATAGKRATAKPASNGAAKKTPADRKTTSAESTARRSRAATAALKREGTRGASSAAMSKQGKEAASRRPTASRSAAAKKAAMTKGAVGRSAAAKKAAHTRATRAHH
jgi:hypothetical protein